MHRVRMLRHYGVEPYMVFDGGPLPAKRHTEIERAKRRAESRAQVEALMKKGLHSQAEAILTKCVDVTPEMAYQVIKALKAENVAYVVAPYEADAQMAFLEQQGIVTGIITEDSDLLVFGCKNVIFKLDSGGDCVVISRKRFGEVRDTPLTGWGDKEFREMAILSGCDYLPSISGMGIKTSYKLLRKWNTVPRVLQCLRMESKMKVPEDYLEAFRTAELPFLYQRVYDPESKRVVPLTPISAAQSWDEEKDAYVGRDLGPETAQGIANGTLHPKTYQPIDDINAQYRPETRKGPLREKNAPLNPANGRTLKDFFSVIPKSKPSPPQRTSTNSRLDVARPTALGTNSGARTLSEQMDSERELQKQKIVEARADEIMMANGVVRSRFFDPSRSKRKRSSDCSPTTPRHSRRPRPTSPSNLSDKENVVISSLDQVEQEEGYRTPDGSDILEVSSPIEHLKLTQVTEVFLDDDPDRTLVDDTISSSPTGSTTRSRGKKHAVAPESPTKVNQKGTVLVVNTPESSQGRMYRSAIFGPDLGGSFLDDIEGSDSGEEKFDNLTPDDQSQVVSTVTIMSDGASWDDRVDFQVDVDLELDGMDGVDDIADSAAQKVMLGWRNQWSHIPSISSSSIKSSVKLSQTETDGGSAPSSSDSVVFLEFKKGPSPVSNVRSKFKRRQPLQMVHPAAGQKSRRPTELATDRVGRGQVESGSLDAELPSLSLRLDEFRYRGR
ncbi:Rad2 nuclease [Tulasnella sp. 403]|nr:Rad2 nuclease [Tulasnella sp. 403]